MTEPLAREKVEQACAKLQDLYPHLKNIQLILDTDDALRQQLAEVMKERDAAETRNENYRMKLNARDQQLAEATYRLNVLEPEYTACQARAAAAEQALAEEQARIAEMEQERDAAIRYKESFVYYTEEQHEEFMKENNQQVADLTAWLEIARDTCAAWNRYAETLTAKLAVCQKQLVAMDELPKHSVAYQQRITALEQQLAEATYRLDVLEPEHTACQARAAAAEGECDRLENAAEHWHTLYWDCAAEKADAAARYGQEIVDLEQGLAAAYLEVRHYRAACASVGETDGHGWAETTKELRKQLAEVIAERDAAETRNENYGLKLNASDSVIAQLSEHLADDQAEIARLQERP